MCWSSCRLTRRCSPSPLASSLNCSPIRFACAIWWKGRISASVKGREGNITNLRAWAAGTSMEVHAVDERLAVLTSMHVVEVRSSMIRWLIAYGRVRDAAICLGRPYMLRGVIVKGFQRGRLLGMPTANFDCGEQMVPADGVYAGRCMVGGVTYPAGVSIGTLPTFDGTKRQVEAHLLGFDGDLYGQTLELEVIDFLRDQVKFKDVEQLKEKMWRDMETCRQLVGMDPAMPITDASRPVVDVGC